MFGNHLSTAVFIISSVILIPSIILNGSGLYFLLSIAETATNQRVLLVNMSLVELLCATTLFISRSLVYFDLTKTKLQSSIYAIIYGMHWFFYYIYLLAPVLLVFDRLIGVITPLLYKEYFSKRRAIVSIALTWMLGAFLSVPFLIMNIESWLNYCPFAGAGIELLVIIIFLCAYSRIGYEIWNRPENIRRSHGNFKVLKMASLIIVTFVTFVALPEVIVAIMVKMNSNLASEYGQTVYCVSIFNMVIDPIIYLFGFPSVRENMNKKLFKILRKGRHQTQDPSELPALSPSIPRYDMRGEYLQIATKHSEEDVSIK